MEQNYSRFKNYKELDIFIQNSLDKYFYVEPWKKLYERTGKLHRDIISDKSTIPDLIIYNKTFNKSDCFIGSKEKSYIKFPRMRFILRPKYKKEYNPTCTYGKDNEVYFYNKQKMSDNKKNLFLSLNNNFKDERNSNEQEAKTFLKQNIENVGSNFDDNLLHEQEFKTNEKINYLKNIEDEEDEEDPEWANDNVDDYNNKKIEFKAIPKSVEEKMNEEFGLVTDNINKINLDNVENNYIDIDSFFKSDNENNLNIIKINSNIKKNDNSFQENKDFINKGNETNEIKEEISNDISKDNNNDNDLSNNFSNKSIEEENINKHFNIFDTENKFNDIFIGQHKSNDSNNSQKNSYNYQENNDNRKNSRFFNMMYSNDNENLKNLNEMNKINENQIKNLLMIQQQKNFTEYMKLMQMKNSLLQQNNNINLPQQQSSYLYMNNSPFSKNQIPLYRNNQDILSRNVKYEQINYLNNLNQLTNNSNYVNSINNNYAPFSYNVQGANIPNKNLQNSNTFNNMNYNRLNMNNININNKEMYVNSINNMIYRNNNNNQYYPNNLIGSNIGMYNKMIDKNSNFNLLNNINKNNIIPIKNNDNTNISSQNILKKNQDNRNCSNIYNNYNINNNINTNISNNNNDNFKKLNEQKNSQKVVQKKENVNDENPNKYVNPTDYLENPSLILKKNLTKKNWLVVNKDDSIIHNFNSEELLKFLEDKVKNDISLEEFTINDYDTDVVFPAKVIYENLKNFYSKYIYN